MGEGGTPLLRATNLGMMLGCPNLYIKDERQGPTSSFKDRQAAVNIAAIANDRMHRFMSEFGLTPAARTRLAVNLKEEKVDVWEGLLGEG